MAIERDTLRLAAGIRIALSADVDDATRQLAVAWARAWNELAPEWERALEDILAASRDGQWPSRRQIMRATRAGKALQVTREALDDLRDLTGVTIVQRLEATTAAAASWEAQLIASQLPAVYSAGLSFDRVDPKAIEAIVRRSTQQVTATSRPLSIEATARMKATLIRGVAIGEHPRTAATRMLANLRGGFAGGLTRAQTIARTELLDAHRAAASAQDLANRDLVTGWVWDAELDSRTCPSCWVMDGTEHPLEQAGPHDHQNGRCARLPKTKSWRELGIELDEPASVKPDARALFDQLPEADQLSVMGAQRLQLLRSGRVEWSQLSTRRSTAGWRDSFAPTPVRDLLAA